MQRTATTTGSLDQIDPNAAVSETNTSPSPECRPRRLCISEYLTAREVTTPVQSTNEVALFDCIHVDTLVASVRADPAVGAFKDSLVNLYKSIKRGRSTEWTSPTGERFTAFRVGARSSHGRKFSPPIYRLGLRSRSGVVVLTVPRFGFNQFHPVALIRFPSSWCWSHTLGAYEPEARAVCKALGIDPSEVYPQSIHLAVDVPRSYADLTTGHLTGHALSGKARINEFENRETGEITGFNNRGTRKANYARIYDKANAPRSGVHKTIRRRTGHSFDEPVTRVEVELSRMKLTTKTLPKKGLALRAFSDLTPEWVRGAWAWFTTSYMRYKNETGRRTTLEWERIQNARFVEDARLIEIVTRINQTRLARRLRERRPKQDASASGGDSSGEEKLRHSVSTPILPNAYTLGKKSTALPPSRLEVTVAIVPREYVDRSSAWAHRASPSAAPRRDQPEVPRRRKQAPCMSCVCERALRTRPPCRDLVPSGP